MNKSFSDKAINELISYEIDENLSTISLLKDQIQDINLFSEMEDLQLTLFIFPLR